MRDQRKKDRENKKKLIVMQDLIKSIRSRGVKLAPYDKQITQDEEMDGFSLQDIGLLKSIDTKSPSGVSVHLVESEFEKGKFRIVWPVLFTYPEYKVSEIVEEFHEDSIFSDHLSIMFETTAEWDEKKAYQANDLEIYYELDSDTLCKVNSSDMLGTVLSSGNITVLAGTPAFIVVSKLSTKFWDHFKTNYKYFK